MLSESDKKRLERDWNYRRYQHEHFNGAIRLLAKHSDVSPELVIKHIGKGNIFLYRDREDWSFKSLDRIAEIVEYFKEKFNIIHVRYREDRDGLVLLMFKTIRKDSLEKLIRYFNSVIDNHRGVPY